MQTQRPSRLRGACDYCTESKLRCTQDRPACSNCMKRGHQKCIYSPARRPGRPRKATLPTESVAKTNGARNTIGFDNSDTSQSRAETASTSHSGGENSSSTAAATGSEKFGENNNKAIDTTTSSPLGTSMLDSGFDLIFPSGFDDLSTDTAMIMNGSLGPDLNLFTPVTEQDFFNLGDREIFESVPLVASDKCLPPRNYEVFPRKSSSHQIIEPSPPDYTPSTEDVLASLLYSSPFEAGGSTNQCKCPSLLGQLIQIISQPASNSLSAPTLDHVLAADQAANFVKTAIDSCTFCDLSSPYIGVTVCNAMTWILDRFEALLRDGTLFEDGAQASCSRDNNSDYRTRHATASQVPTPTSSSTSVLYIGQFPLPVETARACLGEVLKSRLRRQMQLFKNLVLSEVGGQSAYATVLRSLVRDACRRAEAIFGMIDI